MVFFCFVFRRVISEVNFWLPLFFRLFYLVPTLLLLLSLLLFIIVGSAH